ncbi:MAG: hypothetical protein CXZ00_00970 [Acidobacteria bacterium]|nr:MAG: hypothetical protein CXZ00_00970 [Acidobacteriota bacterium]
MGHPPGDVLLRERTEVIKVKTLPNWLMRLLPNRDQSIRQRFVGILVLWGIPIMIWELVQSGVIRDPAKLPFILGLEVIGTVIGAFFFALVEHVIYRSF